MTIGIMQPCATSAIEEIILFLVVFLKLGEFRISPNPKWIILISRKMDKQKVGKFNHKK
jgi:hypothetical protein